VKRAGHAENTGLRMAADVIGAVRRQSGALHKPDFDAYLDQVHDVELVSVDAVLHDRSSRR
jgi:hypothetical protein